MKDSSTQAERAGGRNATTTARSGIRLPARPAAVLAAVIVVLATAVACTRGDGGPGPSPDGPDPAAWQAQTAHLLAHLRGIGDDPVVIFPSREDLGPYLTGLALVALGPEVVDRFPAAERERIAARVLDQAGSELLHTSPGGPGVWQLEMLLDAAEFLPELADEALLAAARRDLDEILSGRAAERYGPEWPGTVLDVGTAVVVAERIGHRVEELRDWAARVAPDPTTACDADVFQLRYTLRAGLPVACDEAELLARVEREVAELTGLAATEPEPLLRFEADRLANLVALWEALAGDSSTGEALAELVVAAHRGVATMAPEEGMYEMRNVRLAALRLGLAVDVPPVLGEFLQALASSGGIPNYLSVADADPVDVLRLASLVGAPPPDAALASVPALERLLATTAGGPAPVGAGDPDGLATLDGLITELATRAATDPDALAALGRAVLHRGEGACALLGDRAGELAAAATELPPAEAALTLRALSRCPDAAGGRAPPGAAYAEQVAAASTELVAAASAAVADLAGQPPPLPVAADAVTVLCALAPDALPAQADRWAAYRQWAYPFGGVVVPDTGEISIRDALRLAVVVSATGDACTERGIPTGTLGGG